MKTFKSLPTAERIKINMFHSIHYDMNIIDASCNDLMTNPDPDFICCLGSKFSSFIESEVLPLLDRHYSINHPNFINHETEDTENSHNDLENN